MKNLKILVLIICFGLSSVAYGETFKKGGINLSGYSPSSVAAQANGEDDMDSSLSGVGNDPYMNSMMNGFSNMLQGMTGCSYSMQEQQKQQMEYVKQQAEYMKQVDTEE